jgi:putative mRNA 3-end processing factor
MDGSIKMSLTVRKLGGILVEYNGQGVMLDPTRNTHGHPTLVSHAHSDHASAFKHPEREKYATQETFSLLTAMGWRRLNNFKPIKIGDKLKFEDIEVKVHNSGHILGSVEYEVNTPEGTVLYTGDLGTESTFTMVPAKPVKCDILVIETTFGSPMFSFPMRDDLAVEIYTWAVNTVIQGRIPTFRADSIGNAQEVISILNQYTNIPIVTTKSTSRVTTVYRNLGYDMDSIDANTDEGKELLQNGRCALIIPKGSKPIMNNLEIALVSGWATIMGRKHLAFPLSDHADFKSLLGFIRRCNPKRVLTFHGGNMTKDFHKHVKKTLGIPSSPLTSSSHSITGPKISNESRIRTCSKKIVMAIRIPGFLYQPTWLIKEMIRYGFNKEEVVISISYLVENGILRETSEGLSLC